MANKKSRKVGRIGIPKTDSPRRPKPTERVKTTRGNKSGTRQQVADKQNSNTKKEKKDPRLGSKTAIDLGKYKAPFTKPNEKKSSTTQIKKYKNPQEELEAIESNEELDALLEKQASSSLTAAEQTFVDKLTRRYQDLCDLLGIEIDNDDDQDKTQSSALDDPFSQLDAIKLDDFKD